MQASENNGEENPIKDSTNGKVYELGYILVPTLEEGTVPAVAGDLKELITTTYKGEFISEEMPKMMTLAYQMLKVTNNIRNKFTTGYFGWIKFTMNAEGILAFKKQLDLDPNIIRFLILKTVRENTIATKRFIGRGVGKRPLNIKKPDEVAAPINKEEVDKEIDALIS